MSSKMRVLSAPVAGVLLASALAGGIISTFQAAIFAEPALADAQTTFLPLRERLQTAQTLWAKVSYTTLSTVPGERGMLQEAVLRLDLSAGRASLDWTNGRLSYDGLHAWVDTRSDAPAQPLGPAVDQMAADLMAELLGGLEMTGIEETAAWAPRFRGAAIELPFTWDDPYVILLTGREDEPYPVGLTILERSTGEPLNISSAIPLARLGLAISWDVRLEPDLENKESHDSRGAVITGTDAFGDPTGTGSSALPPFHLRSTENRLLFDETRSVGTMVGQSEAPMVKIAAPTCPSVGTIRTKPIQLSFAVDPYDEYFGFLPDALDSACPVGVRMGIIQQLDVPAGVRVKFGGSLSLRNRLSGAVYATRPFEQARVGPVRGSKQGTHGLIAYPVGVNAEDLEVVLSGTIEWKCLQAIPPSGYAALGMDRDAPPLISWRGCYPEMGVYPP